MFVVHFSNFELAFWQPCSVGINFSVGPNTIEFYVFPFSTVRKQLVIEYNGLWRWKKVSFSFFLQFWRWFEGCSADCPGGMVRIQTNFSSRLVMGEGQTTLLVCWKQAKTKEQELTFSEHQKLLKLINYSKNYKG